MVDGNDRQAEDLPRVRPARAAPQAEAADTLIRFAHVTKFFGEGEKRVHVVDDVSFTARRGNSFRFSVRAVAARALSLCSHRD